MSSPTKADLAAAVAKLSEENAALRELLGAARAYADLPHPADYSSTVYAYECERRLDRIAVWANGDQEDMDPGVYLLVMRDRAGHLREEAARPVRHEVRTAPAPAAVLDAPEPAGTTVLATDDEPERAPAYGCCEHCDPRFQHGPHRVQCDFPGCTRATVTAASVTA